MDTGNGYMEMLNDEQVEKLSEEKVVNLFTMGETLKIKDSTFKIVKIKPKSLTLKILKREIKPGEKVGKLFTMGEILKIKDSTFKIVKIKPKSLTLKILKKEKE